MPMREIEEKYTLSEITLMAWRSQEQGYQMRSKMNKPDIRNSKRIVDSQQIAQQLFADTGKPLVDEKGEFTLKHQSGEDVAKFLAGMGLPISTMGR